MTWLIHAFACESNKGLWDIPRPLWTSGSLAV
jgi:hypothetical protein